MVNNTDDHNKNNIATFKTTNEDLDVQPCDCHSICGGNLVTNAIPRCKSDCNSERGMSSTNTMSLFNKIFNADLCNFFWYFLNHYHQTCYPQRMAQIRRRQSLTFNLSTGK